MTSENSCENELRHDDTDECDLKWTSVNNATPALIRNRGGAPPAEEC